MKRPAGYTARIEPKGHKDGDGWPHGTRKWGVTIVNTKTGTSVSFQYHTGPAITGTPTFQDVAQAAITDGLFYEDNQSIRQFARETGHEFDESLPGKYQDPALLKAYRECERLSAGTRRVFGEDFDAMAEWSAQ